MQTEKLSSVNNTCFVNRITRITYASHLFNQMQLLVHISANVMGKSRSSFLHITPTRGHWAWANCIESKSQHHFTTPIFWDLQLCTLGPGWFEHFKYPKKAPCLWFGRFSSRVKCCRHACMQRFTRELKCPNQRQGPFLGHLKCTNQPRTKAQSCSTQKVGFLKWCLFFDSMHFRPWPLPSGGFIQKIPNPSGFHLTRVIWLHF